MTRRRAFRRSWEAAAAMYPAHVTACERTAIARRSARPTQWDEVSLMLTASHMLRSRHRRTAHMRPCLFCARRAVMSTRCVLRCHLFSAACLGKRAHDLDLTLEAGD